MRVTGIFNAYQVQYCGPDQEGCPQSATTGTESPGSVYGAKKRCLGSATPEYRHTIIVAGLMAVIFELQSISR